MMTIHKSVIKLFDLQKIKVPQGAKFLTAQMQEGQPCVWYECESSNLQEERTIIIVGTGNELPMGLNYIGTVQRTPYVWHIYESAR